MLSAFVLRLVLAAPPRADAPPVPPPPKAPAASSDRRDQPGSPARTRIPFPLELRPVKIDEAKAKERKRRRPLLVDLRDPFAARRPGKTVKLQARKLMIPDLKDPFAVRHRPRPKAWVALPNDLRDPFRTVPYDRCGRPIVTNTGVRVQRPRSKANDAVERKCRSAAPRMAETPVDLRDPFRPR